MQILGLFFFFSCICPKKVVPLRQNPWNDDYEANLACTKRYLHNSSDVGFDGFIYRR